MRSTHARRIPAVILAALLGAACHQAPSAPHDPLSAGFDPLRADFNRDAGHVRIVLLAAPT